MVDRSVARQPIGEAVAAAVRGGVDWVQLRERGLEGAELLDVCDELARAARDAASASGRTVRVIVNRRADAALAIAADGVHLGFDAMDAASARRLLGPQCLVGVSVHGAAELPVSGASYAQLAPIFAPRSKDPSRPPLGLAELEAAARCGLPVLAQGGVEAERVASLLAAGAAGVAVTGAIRMAADPGAAAAGLRDALAASRRSGDSPTRLS